MLKVSSFLLVTIILSFGCEGGGPAVGTRDPNDSGGDADADADTDIDADADADSDPYSRDETCVDFPWHVETKPINMLILLDRSKSMQRYTVDATDETYAEVVKRAVDAVVQQHTQAGIINFALNVFPSPVMCSAEYGEAAPEDQTPAVLCQAAGQFTSERNPPSPPEVPFAETISVDTYDAVRDVLDTVGNCGGTPITKSLQWARHYLNSLDLEDDTYVLLATDGAPSCNLNADLPCESATPGAAAEAAAQCLDDLDAVHAVFDLAKDGYRTLVVGVGADIAAFSDVMDVIAYTGGGHLKPDQKDLYDIDPPPSGSHWYYPAGDAESLDAALEAATNEAISCEFEVDWASLPDFDDATKQKVLKSCSQMRVFGTPADGGDKIELTYMARCSDEDPSAADPRQQLGWTFTELEGTPWEGIEAIGEDVSQCRRIKLCNNACAKLKTLQGVKAWGGVSASFGCKPVILVV